MSNTIILVIGVAIVFLSLSTFITIFVIYYQRRQLKFRRTTTELKANFTQQLLQSHLEIQEQTLNAISTEIHDNVGQTLSLAKVQLNIIDQNEVLDKSLLAEAKESVSKAMTDLRDIAKSLNSERIVSSDLPEITAQELHRINRSGIMITSITTEGEIRNIQDEQKLIIFRMIQETLQNIIKHSRAKNVDAKFLYQENFLQIQIKDDGKGFDRELLSKMDGLGLQNITKRALLIGGEAIVDSKLNEGTVITINVPYA
jgi:two-component system NarL family sensor kinase